MTSKKTSTVKTVKTVKGSKGKGETVINQTAQTAAPSFADRWAAVASALTFRIDYVQTLTFADPKVQNQVDCFKGSEKTMTAPAFVAALSSFADGIDVEGLASALRVTDKGNPRYMQAKTLEKVRKGLYSLATGVNAFDGYSKGIIVNIAKHEALSFTNAQNCLNRHHKFDALSSQVELIKLKVSSVGTASSQASSTREMLRICGIATTVKGERNATLAFNDTLAGKVVAGMFGK